MAVLFPVSHCIFQEKLLAQSTIAALNPSKVYSLASKSTRPKRFLQVLEVSGPMEAMQMGFCQSVGRDNSWLFVIS